MDQLVHATRSKGGRNTLDNLGTQSGFDERGQQNLIAITAWHALMFDMS